MHLQPMYTGKRLRHGPLYVSEELYNTGLLLPTMHTLQENDARYIVKVINQFTR
jgi:dTDP-4-amino-4,6-dideoxygalactose transaminase